MPENGADERDYGYFRGEGGTVFRLDLPVHETIAERIAKREIHRVNEDGSPFVEAEPEAAPASAPPSSAPKAAWVDWAVSQGADQAAAEAMTKLNLIGEYGGGE
jgi:hypothetical protein